jgi:hypothetical protein
MKPRSPLLPHGRGSGSGGRRSFEDWLVVCRSLQIGRSAALNAGTNRPIGSKHNRMIGRWLIENGLDGVTAPERYRIGLVLHRVPEIIAWRDGLPEAKQRAVNSPSAVWFAWRRACGEKKAPRASFAKGLAEARATKKPLYWPQDALRRAPGDAG